MMMDEEMGDPLKGDLLSFEIDLDYEFDAAKYFDFSRMESFSEVLEAQRWFETAGSYPPSPFIAALNIGQDALVGNINTFPEFKDAENSDYLPARSDIDSGPEFSAIDEISGVCAVQNGTNDDVPREDMKFIKATYSRVSRLMKPTASQLAKQNRLHESNRSKFMHRLAKPSAQRPKDIIEDSYETGGHASKRRKLEGGHLSKVACVKEQTNLLHKVPQKRNLHVDSNPPQSRLRITIPREPELETAQRAERQRAHRLRSGARQSQEGTALVVQTFKARPLNRKILEAPSLPLPQKSTPRLPQFQPFYLKTDERALQHSATSSSGVTKNPFSVSAVQAGAPGLKKLQFQPSVSSVPQNVGRKGGGCDIVQIKFKAQPLNKELLSSKGDIGVFRSTKRGTTKPMEFNFSTSKRCQQDPPIELFNKLSLNTDIKPASSHAMFPCPHRVNKDWKENINCTMQPAPAQKDNQAREELRRHGFKHIAENSSLPDYRSKTNKMRNYSPSTGIR